jgi:hypothetical protein
VTRWRRRSCTRDVEIELADVEPAIEVSKRPDRVRDRTTRVRERAKSPPAGTMLVSRPTFGVARRSARSAVHSACRSRFATSAKIRFCSCETRSAPKLNRSARAAIASISSEVASPGGVPARLRESVTAA